MKTVGRWFMLAVPAIGLTLACGGDSDTPAPPAVEQVILSPASASVAIGDTRQFGVTGRLSDGRTVAVTVTYSATGGTITSGGVYTAGSVPGTYRVIGSLSGGTLADTSDITVEQPGAGSSQSYTTDFDGTEDPISEGGRWVHHDATLTVVQTTGGVAYGTQMGGPYAPYDDSNAYLPGFGNDYSIEGTVHLRPGTPGSPNREVELLLRWTDDNPLRSTAYGPTRAIGYEININQLGDYMILGRFKGAELTRAASPPHPVSGDKFKAVIQGQTIGAGVSHAGGGECGREVT